MENFHDNQPPLKTLTLEEAEVSKVSLNAYIVSKIAFVNFLGQLCDGMENVDVHKITDAIGLDKRISPYFLILEHHMEELVFLEIQQHSLSLHPIEIKMQNI